MKNLFTANDFPHLSPRMFNEQNQTYDYRHSAACAANEKLNKLIETWPDCVVTLKNIDGGLTKKQYYCATQIDGNGATHRAKLAFIEEIVKEDCKHHPMHKDHVAICRYCGVELVATWKPAGKEG